jgi:hypothetical protein
LRFEDLGSSEAAILKSQIRGYGQHTLTIPVLVIDFDSDPDAAAFACLQLFDDDGGEDGEANRDTQIR